MSQEEGISTTIAGNKRPHDLLGRVILFLFWVSIMIFILVGVVAFVPGVQEVIIAFLTARMSG